MRRMRSGLVGASSASTGVLAGILAGTLALLGGDAASHAAVAQKASQRGSSLAGTWNGSGRVIFPSGDSERARCRATVRREAGGKYGLSATCATSSAKIVQTASVQKVGVNSYAGLFRNAEYDVSGSIRITLKGNRLTASLAGSNGSSAVLAFSR